MKKMVISVLGIIIIVVVLLAVIFLGTKTLDTDSDLIEELYTYLGVVDINQCGGLLAYTGSEVTYDSISEENRLCMAYYQLTEDEKAIEISDITTTNDYDMSVCEIGEGIRFISEDSNCSYEIIAKDTLDEAYSKIYGSTITDEAESFYISSTKACYIEGDTYYCGDAETIEVTLVPESTIYRLIIKASEKMNGDIVITDYYLRITDDKCYQSSSTDSEVSTCSTLLEEGDVSIDSDFVQEYGTLYEHIFKLDENGNYYWYTSRLKN